MTRIRVALSVPVGGRDAYLALATQSTHRPRLFPPRPAPVVRHLLVLASLAESLRRYQRYATVRASRFRCPLLQCFPKNQIRCHMGCFGCDTPIPCIRRSLVALVVTDMCPRGPPLTQHLQSLTPYRCIAGKILFSTGWLRGGAPGWGHFEYWG